MQAARLQSIQALRALAALSVFFAHLIGDMSRQLGGTELVPMYYLGAAGVDLFFVISGFVMTYSSQSRLGEEGYWAAFVRARCARVVPLYWFVMLIYGLLQAIKGNWNVLRVEDILQSALFVPYQSADGTMVPFYGIGWTLNFEMFFYVLFAAAILVAGRASSVVLLVFLCLFSTIGALFSLPPLLAYWSNAIILEFALGISIAILYRAGIRIPTIATVSLGLFGLSLIFAGGWLGYNSVLPELPTVPPRWIAWGLPSAFILAAVALRSTSSPQSAQAVIAVGNMSYSIYLLHPIVIIAGRPVLPILISLVGDFPTVGAILHAVWVSVALVSISALSFQWFETPMNNALRGPTSRSQALNA